MLAYSLHACILIIACILITCILTLAYFDTCILCTWMLFCSSTYTGVRIAFMLFILLCASVVVKVSMCKCKCRSVSVQRIFRKNPSQCFREKVIFISFRNFQPSTLTSACCAACRPKSLGEQPAFGLFAAMAAHPGDSSLGH